MKALRVGLVGTGSIARSHLRAYREFPGVVTLNAVCDIRRDVMMRFAAGAGVKDCFTDFREMLEKAEIDAVDICTSHDQHEPQVIAAAGAGKHILLEKPMGRTPDECRRMLRAVEEAGVTFMIGHDLRFLPQTRGIKRVIEEGEIGKVRVVRCELFANMPPERNFGAGHWLLDGNLAGGGMLISGLIHQIDLMRYYIGDVSHVFGICRTVHPEFINGAEEYACATLEFAGGAIGSVMLVSSSTRNPYGVQYTLFGDDGTIYSTPSEERVIQFGAGMIASARRDAEAGTFGRFVPVAPDYEGLVGDDPFVNEILHFAACCREHRQPLTSGRDSFNTLKVVFGIYESARTGRRIDLATI
ncbi:MAG: Gfo/Idh/MocA family oxidoreductase [Dehalococcoidales bacterium]|nr:Gfo/Idh/MocA family oxidoreductase [Dehalococcoidales bacterium]